MSERPTTILVFTDRRDDTARITELLQESRLSARLHACTDLDQLGTACRSHDVDLIVYRRGSANRGSDALARFRESLSNSPGLLLLTSGVQPADYLQAGRIGADDVVDLDMPAQFEFTVRRTIEHIRLRRRFERLRQELEQRHVIDDSAYEAPANEAPIPPLAQTIDDALANDRMELLFQPILAVDNDDFENHEVFLRISGEDGHLMPGDFLPIAERYGLMPSIDRWVVTHAITRFREEHQQAKKSGRTTALRFFINISSHSLVDPVAITEISRTIARAKLPPGSIVIEVDRNTIVSRLRRSKELNKYIKKLQLQFSMDHFDIGDNSLNYLKHVELDYIKLNQTLVRAIHTSPQQQDNVRAIVDKARRSGIRVIASQVEQARELAALFDTGVDYIQGYLIAEPSDWLEHDVVLNEIS